jgi:hypothetical protein
MHMDLGDQKVLVVTTEVCADLAHIQLLLSVEVVHSFLLLVIRFSMLPIWRSRLVVSSLIFSSK